MHFDHHNGAVPWDEPLEAQAKGKQGYSAGELLLEDGAHSSALSSGRSNIRLIENELFGPQLGGLT